MYKNNNAIFKKYFTPDYKNLKMESFQFREMKWREKVPGDKQDTELENETYHIIKCLYSC